MRAKNFILIVLSIFLFSLISVNAATVVVNNTVFPVNATACTTGNFYNSTLLGAIVTATAGDTIIVCPSTLGAYTENVLINKSLAIYGFNNTAIINASNINVPVLNITANFVNIINLTIKDTLNNSDNNNVGIGLWSNGSYLNISYSNFTNNAVGVRINGGNSTNITYSNFYDNIAVDLQLASATGYNRLSFNNFSVRGSNAGVTLFTESHDIINNNRFTFVGNGTNTKGVHIRSSNLNVSIYNNQFIRFLSSTGSALNLEDQSGSQNTGVAEIRDNSFTNNVNSITSNRGSTNAARINIFNNTIINSTIAMDMGRLFNANITNVTIINASKGILLKDNSTVVLKDIAIANVSVSGIELVEDSDANLTGVINITNSSVLNNFDFNITHGSYVNSSGLLKINTDFGSYILDQATNITVKALNVTDAGSAETGCSSSTHDTCTLLTNSSNVMNISSVGAASNLNLTMFYNFTEAANVIESQISIGKYVIGGGWSSVGRSFIDLTSGTINYAPITSFSTFGVVRFVDAVVSTTSTTSSSSSGGGGGGGGSTSKSSGSLSIGLFSVSTPDTVSDLANNFEFTFDCVMPYCRVAAKEVTFDNVSPAAKKYLQTNEFTYAGAVNLECKEGKLGDSIVDFTVSSCDNLGLGVAVVHDDESINEGKVYCSGSTASASWSGGCSDLLIYTKKSVQPTTQTEQETTKSETSQTQTEKLESSFNKFLKIAIIVALLVVLTLIVYLRSIKKNKKHFH